MNIILSMIGGVIVAEVAGYIMHRLLHSERIAFLSRTHMIHHLVLYGPKKPIRTDKYLDSTKGNHSRFSFGNVGLEWLVPSLITLILVASGMTLSGIGWLNQVIVLAVAIGWSFIMFSILHDAFHLKNTWWARFPVIRVWFKRARHLHDLHHLQIDNSGRMNKNFGISFFGFDRIFGTFYAGAPKFNESGYRASLERYAPLLKDA